MFSCFRRQQAHVQPVVHGVPCHASHGDRRVIQVTGVAPALAVTKGALPLNRRPTNATDQDANDTHNRHATRSATTLVSLQDIGLTGHVTGSRAGVLPTLVYLVFATLLAVSTYGLSRIANQAVALGTIDLDWERNIFNIPINAFLQGSLLLRDVEAATTTATATTPVGTQSLSDLQYDQCGVRNWTCAEIVRPNTEQVLLRLGQSFTTSARFGFPTATAATADMELKYVTQLTGYNFPAAQFALPDQDWAMTCIVRRTRFQLAQETNIDIDSVALCSRRAYDPDWVCENLVELDAPTYVFKVKHGVVTYLGEAPRHQLYRNPGGIAKLMGAAHGNGLLSTVTGIDEFNGGIIQSSAPWDIAAMYRCKGTFRHDTYTGMRWQGQGVISLLWKSDSLMLTNAVVLWSITVALAVVQFLFLARSSVCVIPVHMAKSLAAPLVFIAACYGNHRLQVLTTYFAFNHATASWQTTLYGLYGPVMFASVLAIMSGPALQLFFNPYLVSPPHLLTLISIINWSLVFVLEAFVFPTQSTMKTRDCELATSSLCTYYSAIEYNYYRSPLFAAAVVGLGILVVVYLQRQESRLNVPAKNTLLRLLNARNVRKLATCGVGGMVVVGADGIPRLDAGILLNKNLIRVSNAYIVRFAMIKYVVIYRLMPPVVNQIMSRIVGSCFTIAAKDDTVTNKMVFKELHEMHLHENDRRADYYR